MQKIIHITDPHLVAPDRMLYSIDPAQRLRDTLAHVARFHADGKLILITGDLADTGDPAAYRLLHDILSKVRLPVYLTLGNHDDRSAFRTVFGGEGFVQATVDLDDWRIILLDTKDDVSHFGCLDGGRFEWLEEQLSSAEGRPVVLAMHHTPGNLHVPCFRMGDMKQTDRFFRSSGETHPCGTCFLVIGTSLQPGACREFLLPLAVAPHSISFSTGNNMASPYS
ncbi:metallophosphoesterase (plasmid) [Rhizobium sp. T1470]|uniref:metallophosphoesterase n=1 Tax=unclassified Rhizobium TaxID=2613769 RepID=UPI001CD1BC2B|nr:metallophosphoesterase [Rhizobium sp. T1473]MCA0806218.1 metallophosphoesterase [Rhizobium sp. T1473]